MISPPDFTCYAPGMTVTKTLAVGADHAGFLVKTALVEVARDAGWTVIDCGTDSEARCDYPDFAHAVAARIEAGAARFGLLVCGSGIGMAIAANRHHGIRCAQAHNATEARLAREHNDANVLAIGARLTGEVVARDALLAFLAAEFEGGRHQERLAKLTPEPTP